jgi:hypothetical protein
VRSDHAAALASVRSMLMKIRLGGLPPHARRDLLGRCRLAKGARAIDASGTVSSGKRDAGRKRHGECVALRMSIADDGKGFDWSQFLDLDVTRSADGHGSGIAPAKAISFDKLDFRGCGNQVWHRLTKGDRCRVVAGREAQGRLAAGEESANRRPPAE